MILSALKRLQHLLIEPPAVLKDISVRHNSRLLSGFLLTLIFLFLTVDGVYLATIPGYEPPWYGYIFLFGSYFLVRVGYYDLSAFLTLIMFPLVIFVNMITSVSPVPVTAVYFLIPGAILAGILLSFRLTVIFTLIEIAVVVSMPFVAPRTFAGFNSIVGPLTALIMSVTLVMVSIRHRDQVEAERREILRQSEEKYRAIVESAVFGIYQSTPAGRFLRVNPALARIYGYDSAQEIVESINDMSRQVYVDALDREQFLKSLQTDGFVTGFVARNYRKDGAIIWISSSARAVKDSKGNIEYFEGTVEDITEKQNLDQARRLSEERYRTISSVMSDYVFSNVQNEKGEIVLNWVAGAFEQISGYTLDEFNARGGWLSTVHPDDAEKDALDMDQLLRGEPVVSELRILHKDGSIRWVRNYAHPVWDAQNQKLIGIYGAVQEISEQKQIEREREDLIRELEAKNAELEEFTYTVSHDLKAPLITIRGFLGFLKQDAHSGNLERMDADIARISDATEKMRLLLNDLLELSRVGRMMNDPVEVDFKNLAFEARDILSLRAQERDIQLVVHDSLPKVYGDHQRLLQVLQNLIDNAVKFMGEQQHPEIEIGHVPSAQEGYASLFVRDNGMGIAPQYHERIFGLFNRLIPSIEGTGVGLALVKRIVEFHGGRVWVESEAGAGATFYFTLPVPPAK